jgi:hypothetical protein
MPPVHKRLHIHLDTTAVWGGRILLVLYLMAAFAGFFSPYDPNYYELYPPKATTRPPASTLWTQRREGLLAPSSTPPSAP